MRILPFLHPAWQVAALLVGLWTLVLGLRLRALRRRGAWPRRPPLIRRHARLGLFFVGALLLGYVGGPLTLSAVRGEPIFRSGHSFFATLTILTLLGGAGLGLRLWRGRGWSAPSRDLHVFCMGVGLFLVFVTMMLGLGLLP